MANNNIKSKAVGYTTGSLTLAALGVAACVKGDKALELTEEQKAALLAAANATASTFEGPEIIGSDGKPIAKVSNYESTNTGAVWTWTYTNSNGDTVTAEYSLDTNNTEKFREITDEKGNLIGLYKAPAEGQANGKLYINGKWYDNVEVVDGQLKSGDNTLGAVDSNNQNKFNFKIDGKEFVGNVGTEEKDYQAIMKGGNVVGYQEVSETYPKNIFLYDPNGLNTNGIVKSRANLTELQQTILAQVGSTNNTLGDKAIDAAALKEYQSMVEGVNIEKYKTVDEYVTAVKKELENGGTLLNKLSLGVNDVTTSAQDVFDNINKFLGANIADPSTIGMIGICTVGALAVGGTAALATKLLSGSIDNNKKKVSSATSLNSSYKNINKTR